MEPHRSRYPVISRSNHSSLLTPVEGVPMMAPPPSSSPRSPTTSDSLMSMAGPSSREPLGRSTPMIQGSRLERSLWCWVRRARVCRAPSCNGLSPAAISSGAIWW